MRWQRAQHHLAGLSVGYGGPALCSEEPGRNFQHLWTKLASGLHDYTPRKGSRYPLVSSLLYGISRTQALINLCKCHSDKGLHWGTGTHKPWDKVWENRVTCHRFMYRLLPEAMRFHFVGRTEPKRGETQRARGSV